MEKAGNYIKQFRLTNNNIVINSMTPEQRKESCKAMLNENHWDHIFSECPNLKTLSLNYSLLNYNGLNKVRHLSLENLDIMNTGINLS